MSAQAAGDVVAHYERQLARFGPTPEGMDWKDAVSQRLRFAALCDLPRLAGCSLHEVGAGAGHLFDYLEARDLRVDYSGSDLSPAMVEAARERLPQVRFDRLDILEGGAERRYDWVFCSGVFHVKLDHDEAEWWAFVAAMIRRMFELCRVGIGFNLMSNRVDFRNPLLFYADPPTVLDFCLNELGRFARLQHHSELHEFTVHVYRRSEQTFR